MFRQIEAFDPATTVRGQYRGYVDEEGVHGGSDTETFVATRFQIESWRWAGVPWLIRAGKCLPVTATEAVVEFTAPPRLLFARARASARRVPNHLRFRLGADDGVVLQLQAKTPGDEYTTRPVNLEVRHEAGVRPARRGVPAAARGRHGGRPPPLRPGRRHRGAVAHLRRRPRRPARRCSLYYKGTWGPSEADRLAADLGGWKEPLAPGEHPTG